MKWGHALALGSSLCMVAHPALAGDDVQGLLARGLELRAERHDAEALAVFRQAYELEPSPRARAQIGMAEQALGDWVAAELDLEAVLAASSDPWVARNLAALRAADEGVKRHLAWIRVRANAPNGTLWIDGRQCGNLPLESPVRTQIGEVTVVVRADGYEPFEERVSLTAGAQWDQWVALRAIPAPSVAAPAVPAAPVAEQGVGAVPPAPEVRPGDHRTVAWSLVVTGGVLAGGAVVAHVLASADASIYNDDSRCLVGSLSRDEQCGHYKATAQTLMGVAAVGYGVSAAAVGAGVVLLLTSARSGSSHASASACAPGIGFWGLSCEGRF
jgi:hypothetical protein